MQAKKVAVVGGGLGGLTAAALLARGGCEVTLYERSKHLGGRARTTEVDGFRFNLGPHALYRGGAAMRVLERLGVKPPGNIPSPAGAHALREGRLHTLPRGAVTLMTTDVLSLAGKLEVAKLLAGLARIDTGPLGRMSMREWLETRLTRKDSQALLGALVRVSSYCADFEALSAEAGLKQLQCATAANVLYVDGGWSTLVDAVERLGREAGVRLELSSRVEAVVLQAGGARVEGVRLADGTVHDADAVVLAGSPADVAALVPGDAVLAMEAREAVPIQAATLELGLSALPRPDALFALGLDRPHYVSVHSASAKLAPEGGAMVHVAKYLGGADTEASEAELEAVLDALQPGWRAKVVARRFRPSLTVSAGLPRAVNGGLAGRPAVEVPHVGGLYRVGDWVGAEGMLADASLASAEAVEQALVQRIATPQRRAAGA
ncbi:phytoene desaturase family protein [Corallococcus aberystwythensis]|uniref:NAD(P)/FAD-dependent oxidoreductase n=1 Tax=Corallococcus aberystwythensis TaxID=2316722 RepID=A0A3A8QR46_9BACT|nr:FAD-dependent oxidoreductase [Corallococcus aberystwythensis]RKH67342.1 NAD(P)/FAD-dependent oxidoreductase [Corallococcus aberystwythensis]